MAQLPATRSTRNTLLQDPPASPRSPERHSQPTRLQCPTPGRTGQVGTLPGPRPHLHLRKMRTTNHKPRHMGPRTHPGPHHMDRPRTRTLQPKRRTSQQHENARTLDTTTLTNSASIRDDDMTKGQTERDQQIKQNADPQDEDHKHDPAASATPAKHNNASRTRFGKHGAQDKPETVKRQDQTTQKATRTKPTRPPRGEPPHEGRIDRR